MPEGEHQPMQGATVNVDVERTASVVKGRRFYNDALPGTQA